MTGEILEGLVIAHLGQGLAIESQGKTQLCQTRRQLGVAAVGDWVCWQQTAPEQGRVTAILPRKSVLNRPGRNGKTRPVAANIDKILVVFALQPACDFLLLDQYLAICENGNIGAELVFNKIDQFKQHHQQATEQQLAIYKKNNYQLHYVSTKTGAGLAQLQQNLQGYSCLLAGQSGVGKSSLTNALIPDKHLKTNTLSATSGHGRHTTTAATLYHLPQGGNLIDTPGVAIFGLAEISETQLAQGYREFKPLIEQCQFSDCHHFLDKGCAVRAAVSAKTICQHRYQRFLKLRGKMAS